MNIGVIGINHNIAPIEVREKVSFTDIQKIEAINTLLDKDIEEVIILSTCNRSEIYIQAKEIENKIKLVKDFYSSFFNLANIDDYIFSYSEQEAVEHLFKVASGLDSIVIGEDQILGQVRDAHEFAMKLGSSKKIFNKLFREAITTSKEIKSTIKISQQPLSISYIGIKFLKEKIGKIQGKNALIIGVGKMNKLTIKYLQEEGINRLYLSNRNHGKLKEIKDEYNNIVTIEYQNRYDVMKDIDIVISATASPHTVIKKEDIPTGLNHKIFMMDIALPRDIDASINEIDNIEVYDIDDLKQIHEENNTKRKDLAQQGYMMILEKIKEFEIWIESVNIDPTIKSLNQKCVEIKEDTLDYINRKIELDKRDQAIIDKMLSSALRRLIRDPIINLKQVKNQEKREQYIELIEELFEI